MNSYRKIFSEGLNADDDFSVIGKGQWVNASNVRTFTTDTGATGRLEAINGNVLLFNTLPTGTNRCIGGCSDDAKKRLLFFNWNSNGDHGIYCFDKLSATGYKVLMNADVTGGLNFSKNAYIHSCFIANGQLYWTNSTQNQPRRLNYESGIKAYSGSFSTTYVAYELPVSQSIISWIRRPGGLPPTFAKVHQTSPVVEFNSIKDDAFQFCYRYNFRGYEISVLSPLSLLCNYNSVDDIFNRIDISIPFAEQIEQDVLTIDVAVRFVKDDSYFIIKTWDKDIEADAAEIAAHNAGTTALTYQFFNTVTGEALDSVYKVKPFESLPIYAETCELAKNRAFLANFIEGYDTPKVTSLSVNYTPVNVGTNDITDVVGEWFLFHFHVNHFLSFNSYDYYVIRTTTPFSLPLTPAPVYYWTITTGVPPYPPTLADSDLTFVGSTIAAMTDYFRYQSGDTSGHASNQLLLDQFDTSSISTAGTSTSFLMRAFKDGSSYQVGITFYDLFLRKCGVRKMFGKTVSTNIVSPGTYTISATTANTITVNSITVTSVLPGDIIQLFSTLYNLTYTIVSMSVSGGNCTFTVIETVSITAPVSVTLRIDRNTVVGDTVSIIDGKVSNNYVPFLNWTLDNGNAINEIPAFACYYSIDITKCLTTRFFMDGAGAVTYVQKGDDGLYTVLTTYQNNLSGVAIDITSLESFNIGYTYNEGDICKFVIGSTEYTLPVTGTDGKYILMQLADVGTLGPDNAPTNAVFEILTPYNKLKEEPFFETGNMYQVFNPGTSDRVYSILSGTIQGDIYLFRRAYSTLSFIAEAMNINDKFWRNWFTDAGRINGVDTIGQTTQVGGRRFSNTFIEGAKTNGLSSFEPTNADIIDAENGAINKAVLANKVQADGTVLLFICENECVSTYLGEQELLDTQGSAYVARSTDVIGTSKALKGSLGTSNPESVFEYNGLVFWWDTRNGGPAQYSNNGLFQISKNKMVRAANLFSRKFSSLTADQIEALGSNPYIIGGFDPYHKEPLWSIPTTEATPPKGYLEDYSSPQIIYPYDIYDGQAKTLFYKHEADIWMGSESFEAEKFIRMDNDLYAFKNGALYIQNQGTPCNFFGVQQTAKVMFAANPGAIHTFLSMGLESNKKPSFVHFRTEDPNVQSSDLGLTDFVNRQGVLSASLFRDRLSPNATGNYAKKQISGDRLIGKALLVMLEYEFVTDTTPLQLRVVNIGNNINKGTLINKQ